MKLVDPPTREPMFLLPSPSWTRRPLDTNELTTSFFLLSAATPASLDMTGESLEWPLILGLSFCVVGAAPPVVAIVVAARGYTAAADGSVEDMLAVAAAVA